MIRVLVHGAELDESEQHHLRVRRVEAGEFVEVRDGRGLVGRGKLARSGKAWSVEIEATETMPEPAALVIGVGAGDRDRFGWLVEKAAELGVTRIVPLETERTAGVASKLRDEQRERLQRRAFDAVKQSGAAWAPLIEAAISLEAFAGQGAGARWLADPNGAVPPVTLDGAPVTIAIGPEGGFSERERELLTTSGFTPVTFGPHILRFETAAVAAAVSVATARQRGSARHG